MVAAATRKRGREKRDPEGCSHNRMGFWGQPLLCLSIRRKGEQNPTLPCCLCTIRLGVKLSACIGSLAVGQGPYRRVWGLRLDLRILVAHTMSPIPVCRLARTAATTDTLKSTSFVCCCTMYMKHHYIGGRLPLLTLLLLCRAVAHHQLVLHGRKYHRVAW